MSKQSLSYIHSILQSSAAACKYSIIMTYLAFGQNKRWSIIEQAEENFRIRGLYFLGALPPLVLLVALGSGVALAVETAGVTLGLGTAGVFLVAASVLFCIRGSVSMAYTACGVSPTRLSARDLGRSRWTLCLRHDE